MTEKERLDILLVKKNMAKSRELAKAGRKRWKWQSGTGIISRSGMRTLR